MIYTPKRTYFSLFLRSLDSWEFLSRQHTGILWTYIHVAGLFSHALRGGAAAAVDCPDDTGGGGPGCQQHLNGKGANISQIVLKTVPYAYAVPI